MTSIAVWVFVNHRKCPWSPASQYLPHHLENLSFWGGKLHTLAPKLDEALHVVCFLCLKFAAPSLRWICISQAIEVLHPCVSYSPMHFRSVRSKFFCSPFKLPSHARTRYDTLIENSMRLPPILPTLFLFRAHDIEMQ